MNKEASFFEVLVLDKAALTSLAMIAEVRRKYQDHGATPKKKKVRDEHTQLATKAARILSDTLLGSLLR